MSYDKEKGKSHEDLWGLKSFILFKSYEFHTIKGDALDELVKCKTSKSILPPKSPVRPDICNSLAGFQRLWSSGHLPYPGLTQPIRLLSWGPEAFPGHVRPNPIPQWLSPRTGYIRSPVQVSERLVGYVWPPTWTCLPSQPYPGLRPRTGLVRFPSRVPERFAGHVRVSDTQRADFNGGYKRPPTPL
jgi:hypothetical protein